MEVTFDAGTYKRKDDCYWQCGFGPTILRANDKEFKQNYISFSFDILFWYVQLQLDFEKER